MPREKKTRAVVEPTFEEDFKRLVTQKQGQQDILDAMFVLCQIIDACITENDTWFNVGLQRGGSSVQLTLHEGRDSSYANGRSLSELLSAIRVL